MAKVTWTSSEEALWELLRGRCNRPDMQTFADAERLTRLHSLSEGEQYIVRVLLDDTGIVLDWHESLAPLVVDDEYRKAVEAVLIQRRKELARWT